MARGKSYSVPSPVMTTPIYLHGASAPLASGNRSPIARTRSTQVLGSVVGRRGAGITNLASGDPTHHSMGHYGKKGLPGLSGGDFGDF
jgi:hypothetical protein